MKAGNILLNGSGAVKIGMRAPSPSHLTNLTLVKMQADFGVSEQMSEAVPLSDERIGTPLWYFCPND